MTDNDIIKALECHAGELDTCDECPYRKRGCSTQLHIDALDLINHQRAEIEKYEKRLDELEFLQRRVNSIKNTPEDTFLGSILTLAEGVATYEALQDFSDDLKIKFSNNPETYTGVFYGPQSIHDKINDLLKEKVGESSG